MKIINLIKKLFFCAFRWILKIANILGIFIFIFLSILLYFIIFEVPIKFLNKYVERSVFNNFFTVEEVYLKWDYNIKKPVFILKNINYNNKDMSLGFNLLGVAFDIRKLLYNHQFYPIYINASGFEVSGVRYKDNNFSFDLDKGKNNDIERLINKVNTPESNDNQTEDNDLSLKRKNILNNETYLSIKKYGLLDFFEQHITKYVYLQLLKDIDFDSSKLKLRDEIKDEDFIININNVHINYDSSNKKILVTAKANLINKKNKQNTTFSGNIDIDNNNANFTYNINNIPPSIMLMYSNINNNQKIRTAGLNINTSIVGVYNFKKGLRSLDANINTSEGEIFIEDVLSDKVKINSVKTNLIYKTNNNSIDISNFEVNLNKNSNIKLYSLKGSIVPITKVSFDGNINVNNNFYNFNNIKVYLLHYLITGDASYKKGDIKFQLINNNNINTLEFKSLWPNQLLPDVKKWIVKNVKRGSLSKIYITGNASVGKINSLKSINGNALISNAEINYVDGMPHAVVSKGTLSFDKNHLQMSYNNGKSGAIFSNYGEVGVYNEFPNKKTFSPVIKVDVNAKSNVNETLLFINNKPLNLVDKVSFLQKTPINGSIAGKVYLEYSFFNNKVQNLKIDLVGHNVNFVKVFKDQDLTKADMKLNIKDGGLSLYGTGNYYEIPLNLYLIGYWDNKKPYNINLNIEGKAVSIEKLNELNILPNLIKNNLTGSTDLNVNMKELRNSNKQLFNINVDLNNTKVDNIVFTGYSKPVNSALKAMVNFTLDKNKLTEIQKLYVYNNDNSVQMKLKFIDNNINIVIDSLQLKNKVDIKGNIDIFRDKANINLFGNYLNFEEILKVYEQNKNNYKNIINKDDANSNNKTNNLDNNSSTNKVTSENQKIYNIKLNIKKSESNNIRINNFYFNFGMQKKDLTDLVFSGDFDKNNGITLVYDKNTKEISYNISNLGKTLKFFKVSSNIHNGNLKGDIFLTKDKNNNTFSDGNLLLKSFSAGIVPFSSANINFTGKNLDFNIMTFVLKGNALGGSLSGNYTFNNNYLLLTGYLTPIWSTSQLLVKIPLIGDFLKSNFAQSILSFGVSKNNKDIANRGAFNVPFSIYGQLNNLKYGTTTPPPFTEATNNNTDVPNPIYEEDSKRGTVSTPISN